MRQCLLKIAAALTVISVAIPAQGPRANCCFVSGKVVDHSTRQPLARVAVTLNPVDNPQNELAVITGPDGSFSFVNLIPGKYRLAAQRGPEGVQVYGMYEGAFTAIVVGPEKKSTDIVFPLERSASLSGTVNDENGDPVPNATVILLRRGVVSGKVTVNGGGSAPTNSSGSFRIAHVKAGTYFIAVQGRPWYAEVVPRVPGNPNTGIADSQLDVAYPVTYYGDTTDPQAATPVTLEDGQSANLHFVLHAVAAAHIKISLPTAADNDHSLNASLAVEGPGGVPIAYPGQSFAMVNDFELAGVAPGRYVLTTHRVGRGPFQQLSSEKVDLVDGVSIEARDSRIVSVSGRITFGGSAIPARAAVILAGEMQRWFRALVREDGSFSLDNPIAPGRYDLRLAAGPTAYYFKSVSGTGARFTGDSLEILGNGAVQLSIAAGFTNEKVEGVVVNNNGDAVPAAMVLLLPADSTRPDLIRRDQSDSDGTFAMNNVAPGAYTLLAITDGQDLAYRDPDVMKPYFEHAQSIEVPVKSQFKLEVINRLP